MSRKTIWVLVRVGLVDLSQVPVKSLGKPLGLGLGRVNPTEKVEYFLNFSSESKKEGETHSGPEPLFGKKRSLGETSFQDHQRTYPVQGFDPSVHSRPTTGVTFLRKPTGEVLL